MNNWFECKVTYEKMMENGMQKKVTEPYLVDALSFTEAEARIIEEIQPYITGDFTIKTVSKAKISETFLMIKEIGFISLKLITLRLMKKAVWKRKQQ